MANAAAVLDIARSQLGVVEDPPGSNRVLYAAWAGIQGQPWCAAFACWVLERAGALDVARFVYCPTGVAEYHLAGRYDSAPLPGALVFFQWPGVDRACHVGIVEVVRPDGVVTIEGNTDARGGGTGGKVMRQVRRSNMIGFGHPIFDAAAPPAPPAAPPAPVTDRPVLQQGAGGPYVRRLQIALRIPSDGVFGPQTKAAVQAFQRGHGLAADGIVGPMTWAALG